MRILAGGVVTGDTTVVRWVYPLPPGLSAHRDGYVPPLAYLFDLVTEYGVNLRVDDQDAPLIVVAHWPDGNPDSGRHLIEVRGRSVIVDHLGTLDSTHVVLQHALDASRYLTDLRSAGLGPLPR